MGVIETCRYTPALPQRARRKALVYESDLDVGMILPDPLEDFGRFLEGQNDEQMLGLGVGAATHGEG